MSIKLKKVPQHVHKFWIILGLSVGIGCATLVPTAHALSIRPIIHDFVVEPGEVYEMPITVVNEDNFVEVVDLRAQAFVAGEREGVPEFVEGMPHEKWAHTPQKEFVVQPRESQRIIIPLIIPPDSAPGGYFLGIFAGTRPAEHAGARAARNEVGTLVFITVQGDITRDVRIERVRGTARPWGRTAFDITYTVRNQGNVHEIPRGTITIKNIFTGSSLTTAMNEREVRVLPNSERTITETIIPQGAVRSPFNPLRFGVYEATIAPDGAEKPRTTRMVVWSPIALLIIALLCAAMVRRRTARRTHI